MSKMKAWTISRVTDENGNKSGVLKLKELDKPVCGDDQVVLKVNCASVCGGDVESIRFGCFENHRLIDGGEFGHELAGTIVEKGKDVVGLEIGDRVWPYPTLCSDPPGVRSGSIGGFSEYVYIEKAKKDYNLFLLNDKISDLAAAMIEPMTIGWHAGSQTHPAKGKNAVVFGAGFVAVTAAMSLKWHGCEKVAIVGRRKEKLKICEEMGFNTFSTLDEDWKQQLENYFGKGRSFSGQAINVQCWVEATGGDTIVEELVPMMTFGARMAIVATHTKPVQFNSAFLTFAELEIVGSAGQGLGFDAALEVLECLGSKQYEIEKLATVFKHEDLEAAVHAMKDGKAVKSVIDYTGKYL